MPPIYTSAEPRLTAHKNVSAHVHHVVTAATTITETGRHHHLEEDVMARRASDTTATAMVPAILAKLHRLARMHVGLRTGQHRTYVKMAQTLAVSTLAHSQT